MDKTKKILLLSIAPVFLTLIFILYIVAPTVQKLNEVNDKLKQEKTSYNEVKSELDKYVNDKSLFKSTQDLQRKLGNFDIEIPPDDDVSILLIDLGKFAESLNVRITSLDSRPESAKEIVNPNKKQTGLTTSTANQTGSSPLYSIPLDISAVGYYNNILNFINILEKYERVILINNLSVENYKEDKDTTNPRVQMTINCEIFKFIPQTSEQKTTNQTDSNKA